MYLVMCRNLVPLIFVAFSKGKKRIEEITNKLLKSEYCVGT